MCNLIVNITSKANENIKLVSRLINSAKFRKEKNEFVVESEKVCMEAYSAGIQIKKLFYTKHAYGKFKSCIELISKKSQYRYLVEEKVMDKISSEASPQGILCVCGDNHLNEQNTEDIEKSNKIVILENMQNPANLGAVIRICDAFCVDAIVISKGSCDIYNPKVLRGSMGSVFRSKILVTESLDVIVNRLNSLGFLTVAMVLGSGAADIKSLPLVPKIAIIIGNEGRGISEGIVKICNTRALIPMNSKTDSLNAAVASGIAIWELIGKRMG